jgi:hypothetical protein
MESPKTSCRWRSPLTAYICLQAGWSSHRSGSLEGWECNDDGGSLDRGDRKTRAEGKGWPFPQMAGGRESGGPQQQRIRCKGFPALQLITAGSLLVLYCTRGDCDDAYHWLPLLELSRAEVTRLMPLPEGAFAQK